ncbi:MAG: 16S rRNA (guanine(966)-N(2))-methyltransferase RsmD [Clostridia bacterium]|nr:16S rRNA (guanine(966)-N(2))-methyltransferase RsmD [Clostridia bacterium]
MRIITGTARGKRLQTPDGLHTRPTSDRVKQSVFNIIQFDIEGRKVLDLFGGSGQLGLEAMSRGAASCVIVEGDRNAQKAIEANIRNCGFDRGCQLIKGDAFQFLQRQKPGSYHLIFLDPPYGGELLNRAIAEICRIDILAEGGIMVCESAADDVVQPVQAPYRVVKQYRYGHTDLTIITKGGAE